MAPQVTVIVPTFNRWPLVKRALESVQCQTRPAVQIIVVDDGSTDNTQEQLAEHFTDQLCIIHQSNKGVSSARNSALERAIGDWVAFLDSDDTWHPQKLQKQMQIVESNPDCVLCHTDEIWIRNGKRVNPMQKHKKAAGNIFDQSLAMCAISPSAALVKREIFEQLGEFDESLAACEDYDMWLRICSLYPVHYIDEPLVTKYGGHEDQLSRKHWGMDRFRITALKKLIKTGRLNDKQMIQTLDMLEKKVAILKNGAEKRDNETLINECRITSEFCQKTRELLCKTT